MSKTSELSIMLTSRIWFWSIMLYGALVTNSAMAFLLFLLNLIRLTKNLSTWRISWRIYILALIWESHSKLPLVLRILANLNSKTSSNTTTRRTSNKSKWKTTNTKNTRSNKGRKKKRINSLKALINKRKVYHGLFLTRS